VLRPLEQEVEAVGKRAVYDEVGRRVAAWREENVQKKM
jgi:hypothetical protein